MKFKIGDPIITKYRRNGIIKDIVKERDGSICYFVHWGSNKGYSKYDQTTLESTTDITLDIQKLRNETLSKVLNKWNSK